MPSQSFALQLIILSLQQFKCKQKFCILNHPTRLDADMTSRFSNESFTSPIAHSRTTKPLTANFDASQGFSSRVSFSSIPRFSHFLAAIFFTYLRLHMLRSTFMRIHSDPRCLRNVPSNPIKVESLMNKILWQTLCDVYFGNASTA